MKCADSVHMLYKKANAKALMINQQNQEDGRPIAPVSLDRILDGQKVVEQQDLGTMAIPTGLIIGVAQASDAVKLYTTEFLPLAVPESDLATRWREICHRSLREMDDGCEIRCLEYLGQFYVSEGLEQVSVMKFCDVPTIRAEVVRITTTPTGSKREQLYSEFLQQFHLTGLYQLQFTQPKYFAKLQAALGKMPSGSWNDYDRAGLVQAWPKIESAFYRAFDHSLNLTAADALGVLLENYPYDLIIQMEPWTLARIFQVFWKELYSLSFPDRVSGRNNLKLLEIFQTA